MFHPLSAFLATPAQTRRVRRLLAKYGTYTAARAAGALVPASLERDLKPTTKGAGPMDWMTYARSLVGVREIKGPQHSGTIMGWIKRLGAGKLGITVRDDETAWCGTFVAHVMDHHGLSLHERERPHKNIIAVRAKAWLDWGRVLVGPRYGCVLVFDREGGGHVGFYVGEDHGDPSAKTPEGRKPAYHVLGGNQGNAVSITRIAKNRCVGMRWPMGPMLPKQERIWLTPGGVPVSANEA